MRRHWLSLCTVWPSHSQISSLSTAILALGKARSHREPNMVWQTWVMRCFARKILHESCKMGRHIVVMKLICSLGHCECDSHRVHKLSQRRLTADWLSPRESDCSRMNSTVSSDRLPSYIKATRPVLEIFKMAEYFSDSPRRAVSRNACLPACYVVSSGQQSPKLWRILVPSCWQTFPKSVYIHQSSRRIGPDYGNI